KITKQPIFIYGLNWHVRITANMIKLGCKHFTIDEWASFTDEQITEMDDEALEFWDAHKLAIMAMSESHRVKQAE
ncbi:hypothetical protein DF186_18030, partial [Enterococcus hirae]